MNLGRFQTLTEGSGGGGGGNDGAQSGQNGDDADDEIYAVAVLRRRVEHEALASLGALEVSEDLVITVRG